MPYHAAMGKTLDRYKRYAQVVSVGAKHDFGWLLDKIGLGKFLGEAEGRGPGPQSPLTYAERIRLWLDELGPTFVKLGQILSTRPDLIPHDVIVELKKLQDEVEPVPFDAIRPQVEAELGAPIEERFSRFEETPLAAASIAQVHRAWLPDGRLVAVKVQRPGIEGTIRTDLAILYDMARLLRAVWSGADLADPVLIVREFERSILRELDFVQEAHLTDEFRQNLRGLEGVRVAKVEWDHTTRRVLTMEFFEGVKLSDDEALDAAGHDRVHLAKVLARVTMESIFKHGLVHADPHPGNLLVLEDGALALIDFGMVGRYDRHTIRMLRALALDLARRDFDALAATLLQYGVVDYDADLRILSRKLRTLFRTLTGGPVSLAEASELLMGFLVSERLYYQPDLILLDKTFGTLEGTVRGLCPDTPPAELLQEFAPELEKSTTQPREFLADLAARLWAMEDVLIDTPPLLHRVLGRLDAGKLTLRVERRLGADGVAEVAALLQASVVCLLGVVALAVAPLVTVDPTPFVGGGAAALGLGLFALQRLRRSG